MCIINWDYTNLITNPFGYSMTNSMFVGYQNGEVMEPFVNPKGLLGEGETTTSATTSTCDGDIWCAFNIAGAKNTNLNEYRYEFKYKRI